MPRRNFLITLSYDGSGFQGWQRLPGRRTVQGEVEAALGAVLGLPARPEDAAPIEIVGTSAPLEVVGAGRTDAGVHAEGQGASFHAFTALSCGELREALNAALPADIRCSSCVEVDPRFHARLHAASKTYRYRLLLSKSRDAELERTSLRVEGPLDLGAMREAAVALLGERDFRALSNAKGEDTARRLDEARIEEGPAPGGGSFVDLLFVGPGFIYNQVRVMASLLLEVGRGRIPPERVASILEGRDRSAAPGALPPQGLCLLEVRYRQGAARGPGMVGNQKTGRPRGR